MPERASRGLVIAGYATGLLIPVVGFFVGLAVLFKNRAGHGIVIMIISVLAGFYAFALLTNTGDDNAAVRLPAVEQTPWCNPWNDLEDDC